MIKNSSAKVTVVIPCFNHEHYVERAIVSVCDQTYDNFELVVVDDGSVDGSVNKLQMLQAQHNFTLITQQNQGVCKTINRAIREYSSGKYIAILASDDFWHREKLKLQMEELARHPGSHFCFSQAIEFVDGNNKMTGRKFPNKCLSGWVLNSVFLRQHVPAGTMIFSRDLYDRLNGFDEKLKEEDWDFVIRSAAETEFCSINKPLLFYRSHAKNTMKIKSGKEIFFEKAKILSKNIELVGPWRWMQSVAIHFVHDIIYRK